MQGERRILPSALGISAITTLFASVGIYAVVTSGQANDPCRDWERWSKVGDPDRTTQLATIECESQDNTIQVHGHIFSELNLPAKGRVLNGDWGLENMDNPQETLTFNRNGQAPNFDVVVYNVVTGEQHCIVGLTADGCRNFSLEENESLVLAGE